MYSQVELGSDTESERGSASRRPHFLSQERLQTTSNIIYEEKGSSNKFKTTLNSHRNSLSRDNSMSAVDVNVKRKMDGNLKWFTSQITELPGPKKNLVRNIGQEYKVE